MFEQAADTVVECLDRRGIDRLERARAGRDQRLPGGVWDVGIVVREIQEEGTLTIGVDEALRLPGEIVLALSPLPLARNRGRLAGVEDVESLLERTEAGAPEVPFAQGSRCVPGVAQPLRQRRLAEWQVLPNRRVQHSLRGRVRAAREKRGQVEPRRSASGQDRRPRRRADRRCHVGGREPQSFGGKSIQMRRAVVAAAIGAEVVDAKIIREDEDDVRRPRLRPGDGARRSRRGNKEREGDGAVKKSRHHVRPARRVFQPWRARQARP